MNELTELDSREVNFIQYYKGFMTESWLGLLYTNDTLLARVASVLVVVMLGLLAQCGRWNGSELIFLESLTV